MVALLFLLCCWSKPMENVAVESGEVFTKQPLLVSSDKPRSKQKRRIMKSKGTTGNKSRKQGTSAAAIILSIANKEELLKMTQKENAGTSKSICITNNRITQRLSSQKVGIYSKGKASGVVSKGRKCLAEINTKSGEPSERDIRCALGLNSSKPTTRSPIPNGYDSSDDMEYSPHRAATDVSIQAICHRLAKGLQPDKVFQGPDYLATVKAELRKVMKQSDPDGFSHLMACLAGETDSISTKPLTEPFLTAAQSCPSSPTEYVSPLGQLFGSNVVQTHTLPASAIPVQNIVELPPGAEPQPCAIGDCRPEHDIAEVECYCNTSTEVWGEVPSSTSMDILDIVDNTPAPVMYNPPAKLAPVVSPPRCWMPAPDRPRMFPRKLY